MVKSSTALTFALTSHCSHPAERLTHSTHTVFYFIWYWCITFSAGSPSNSASFTSWPTFDVSWWLLRLLLRQFRFKNQFFFNFFMMSTMLTFYYPRSFLPEHHHRRPANRKPKQFPKRLQNVVAELTNPDLAPRAHCHSGLLKTNRNFAPWRRTRSLDFHGGWSRPRWASPRKMFALCGIRLKTNLADQRHARTKKKLSCGTALQFHHPTCGFPFFFFTAFITLFRPYTLWPSQTRTLLLHGNFEPSHHTPR